jgi:UDP:flavonoid glycosyltransferase YjiC (YdhE family)
MHQKLTILFAPIDAVGHVNACIGIAEVLKERGHKIVFAISDMWSGKLTKYGFEEEITLFKENKTTEDPAKYWADFVKKTGFFGSIPPIEKITNMSGFVEVINEIKNSNSRMKEIVDRVKPDVILIDGFIYMPSLMNSGIPWVWSMSCNPLAIDYAIDDERIPPSCLGLTLIFQF